MNHKTNKRSNFELIKAVSSNKTAWRITHRRNRLAEEIRDKMKSISKELVGASAVPIILSVLKNGDSYGYKIVQRVKELTNGEIAWKEASIYPVLKKLENADMIKSYWKVEENKRPRKYYTILSEGKKQLKQNMHEWNLVYSVFNSLWKVES